MFSPRWLFFYPALALAIIGTLGLGWLSFGPQTVGNVTFSVQTMLAFATSLIVGLQGVGFAAIARSYAADLGLLPNSAGLEDLLDRITLDRGLVIGTSMMLLGHRRVRGRRPSLGRGRLRPARRHRHHPHSHHRHGPGGDGAPGDDGQLHPEFGPNLVHRRRGINSPIRRVKMDSCPES